MSGIAAVLSTDGTPLREAQWRPLTRKLQNYGPHGQRLWQRPGEPLFMAHSLFAVTPEDRLLPTATASPDGRWLLMTDLRLDARADLARQLAVPATALTKLTDEELAALAFGQWGEDAVQHLYGSFAIIAWDARERRLHLMIDTSGDSQLYFHHTARRTFVCNKAPPLLEIPDVERRLDYRGLLDFYTDQREPWRTTLAGIELLPTGHAVSFCLDGSCTRRRWWTPAPVNAWRSAPPTSSLLEDFVATFTAAVGDRLRSVGAPGGFCSGGLDSPSVSAVAAQLLRPQGATYRTYTAVPDHDWTQPSRGGHWEDDERPYVRALVQQQPNIEATFVAVNGTIFLDCLPALIAGTAWPTRNTYNMPWFLAIWNVMREDGVHVPLSGGRGNSTISFDGPILADLLAANRYDLLLDELRVNPRAFTYNLAEWAYKVVRVLPQKMLPWTNRRRVEREWQRRVALHPAAARSRGIGTTTQSYLGGTSIAQSRQLYTQRLEAGSGMSPLEIDVCTRPLFDTDPTVDRRVVEFCWRVPPPELRHGGERRRLIRRAMQGCLPDKIRLRTTRGTQGADTWNNLSKRRTDLRSALEYIADDAECRELLDIAALRGRLDTWPAHYEPRMHAALIPLMRSIAMGLYIRWINTGSVGFPGARPPATPSIERFSA